jgi:hypothetical protein
VVILATVLGSLAVLRDDRAAPGSGVRLQKVGGVYVLATGSGRGYRLRLPRGWGVASEPAERWVEVAQQRSCEAAALSALELVGGTGRERLEDRASTLLWQVLGRAAEPSSTLTSRLRRGAVRAVVAADLRARIAVMALAPADGAATSGGGAAAVIVQGIAGPGPGCDHRSVDLTPEHLGNLIAAVETPLAALR